MIVNLIQPFSSFAASYCTKHTFFTFPTWYEYLSTKSDSATHTCRIAIDATRPASFFGALPLILLALLDIALRLASLVAVAFVIYGGIKYVMSRGEPDAIASARNTITDALIGLAIALVAIAFVAFLGAKLG